MKPGPPDAVLEPGGGRAPAGHGVVLIRSGGVVVRLAATADLRRFVDSMLCVTGPIGDRAECWLTGSGFESDLLFLSLARLHAPDLHKQAERRLTAWWLAADSAAPGAGWSVCDLAEGRPTGSLIGPFLDRSAAKRWSAMLDDRFELCRYPAELRRAPRGTACAYKQMGRCPAACDGSETMTAYTARLDRALGLRADVLDAIRERLTDRMAAEAGSGRFESAAVLRDSIDALPDAGDRAAAAVDALGAFAFVAAVSGRGRGSVVLLELGVSGWRRLGEADARKSTGEQLEALVAGEPIPDSGVDLGVVGLVAREVIRPRRGGPILLKRASLDADALLSAARRAGKIADA